MSEGEPAQASSNRLRVVTFPAGTYLMRRLYGVCCDALDTPWCCRCAPSGY